LLTFDFSAQGTSGELPGAATVQPVAQLQPLEGTGLLAVVATLTTVTIPATPEEAITDGEEPATAALSQPTVVPTGTGATDRPSPSGDEEGEPSSAADGKEATPPPTDALVALWPLARFLIGLDQAFERVRLEARRGLVAADGRDGPAGGRWRRSTPCWPNGHPWCAPSESRRRHCLGWSSFRLYGEENGALDPPTWLVCPPRPEEPPRSTRSIKPMASLWWEESYPRWTLSIVRSTEVHRPSDCSNQLNRERVTGRTI
jgi:hypothetical protein